MTDCATPQVDFYILPHDDPNDYQNFICRLTHKIYRLQQQVLIQVTDGHQAQHWHQLLWSFQTDSFIAHGIDHPQLPVNISQNADQQIEVCINLKPTPCLQSIQAKRCLEILYQHPDSLQQGRERFRQYKQWQWPINTHNI